MVLSPHGNARYLLDGNRPLWYILLRYSANTVMYGTFYIFTLAYFTAVFSHHFLGYSRVRVVLRASTFTEHKNHQTWNLNMKYSGEFNKRQCPDHRQTLAANSLFWTSNSLKVPTGVKQDYFSSTFLLRYVPLFSSREGFSRPFPSSTVKSK